MGRDAGIVAAEVTAPDNPYLGVQSTFDWRVLDDEKMLKFFTPGELLYRDCYVPLMPIFSRLLTSISLTDREVRLFCIDVDRHAEDCHSLASTLEPNEWREAEKVIDSLADHAKWRVTGAARGGFLLRTITEHKKTLRLIGEHEKRKRFLGLF